MEIKINQKLNSKEVLEELEKKKEEEKNLVNNDFNIDVSNNINTIETQNKSENMNIPNISSQYTKKENNKKIIGL